MNSRKQAQAKMKKFMFKCLDVEEIYHCVEG